MDQNTQPSCKIKCNHKFIHIGGVIWRAEGLWPPEYTHRQRQFFDNYLARPPEKIWLAGEILSTPCYRRTQDEKLDTQVFEIPFLGWATGLRSGPIFAFLRFLSSLVCHISAVMKAAQVQLWRTIDSWGFYWTAKVRNSTVEIAPATNGQTFENLQYRTSMRLRPFYATYKSTSKLGIPGLILFCDTTLLVLRDWEVSLAYLLSL